MKPYSSYPNKSATNPDHVTNEDLLSHFEKQIEGLETSLTRAFKESIETCTKFCNIKIEHLGERADDTEERLTKTEDAIVAIQKILEQGEGSRKTFNWIFATGIAILTLLFLYWDLKG